IRTTGTSWGFDAVLYPMNCAADDWFTMIDGAGRILWYEPNDVYFQGIMTGYDWSQSSRTVLSVNDERFQEQDVGGAVVLELAEGTDFDAPLHHDTARWGALRYLLFEYPVGGLLVDGIHVFDGPTLVGTFLLGDHFFVPGDGAGDWAHGNGLKVSDDGDILLSLHVFSSVLSIDGDPASPTFLEIEWLANGAGGGLPSPDYVPVGEGFLRQHNASRHGDDLWVFDNDGGAHSQAVRLAIDDLAGTITTTGTWSFDTDCPNQGGAIPLPGGGVLATCANANLVWAFEEASTEPDWTLTADCGQQGGAAACRSSARSPCRSSEPVASPPFLLRRFAALAAVGEQ
ncbi:MAG: hypothetical protein H0V89_07215, partial [Deltaproteobacteria bacterium]|nr:hypothetical protein [Deltaproteobacteria bacterium]